MNIRKRWAIAGAIALTVGGGLVVSAAAASTGPGHVESVEACTETPTGLGLVAFNDVKDTPAISFTVTDDLTGLAVPVNLTDVVYGSPVTDGIPMATGTAYSFTVTTDGYKQTFAGTLCGTTPTSSPSSSDSPTASPSPSDSPTASPSPSDSPTASPSPSASPSSTPSASPAPNPPAVNPTPAPDVVRPVKTVHDAG